MKPIRVFVGTEPKTAVALQVLAHSIRERTRRSVEITPMIGPGWEVPDDLPRGTGFSLRRFLIPSRCDFRGQAIYLDADQLVLADVEELWDHGKDACPVACTVQPPAKGGKAFPQSSVMVIDCAQADWKPDELWTMLRRGYDYQKLQRLEWTGHHEIPAAWNHLHRHVAGESKLVHFTREPDQPWYQPKGPLARLWQTELQGAIMRGAVDRDGFEQALARWGRREDWRKSNGLHPFYSRYLGLFGRRPA